MPNVCVSARLPLEYHQDMERSDWIGLCGAVGGLWFAFAADVAILAVYRGSNPESLHAYCMACYLAVLFGVPVAALVFGGSVRAAKNRREIVPKFALRFCTAAWVLLGLVLACIVAGMSYGILRESAH